MRKRRSDLTGENHPTLWDPSPLDACGWCLHWIAEGAPRHIEALDLNGEPSDPGGLFHFWIDRHPLMAVATDPDGRQPGDPHVAVVLCSDQCRDELRQALDDDAARNRGEAVPPRTPTPEERLEAEAIVKDHCAWCLTRLSDDADVATVSASLHDDPDPVPGFISLDIGGRPVHALVPPAGSGLVPPDHHVLFVLCGAACAHALIDVATVASSFSRIH